MSLFIAILIGIAVSVAAGFLIQDNIDLLMLNVLMGIAGAVMGMVVYFLSDTSQGFLLFNWSGAFCSLVGAVILVALFSVIHKLSPKKPGHEEHPLE